MLRNGSLYYVEKDFCFILLWNNKKLLRITNLYTKDYLIQNSYYKAPFEKLNDYLNESINWAHQYNNTDFFRRYRMMDLSASRYYLKLALELKHI